MNPRVLKKQGFKHLDRVVELCAKQGIWTILDLHCAPGAQNQVSNFILNPEGLITDANVKGMALR